MNSKIRQLVYISSLFCFCYSCTNYKAEVIPSCTPPGIVSFSQHIVPLLNARCNISGCHSGSQPQGNLNLESAVAYRQLMKSGSGYVDTINPKYSVLYSSMNSISNPMPPTGRLDDCSRELVLKWIQQKAKNN